MAVAPGVFWLRMPLPFEALDHINLWLIDDGDGWTVVDTGFKSRKVEGLWREILAAHCRERPLKRVICTHFHPDHMGMAGWFHQEFKVPLWMTLTEWSFGRMLCLDAANEVPDEVLQFYHRAGFDDAMLADYRARGYNRFAKAVWQIPRAIHRLTNGDEITLGGQTWRVIVGRGHSPEHASLHCPALGVMISGDQVLPRITPHIGVYPAEPEANPLKLYIRSLERFRGLDPDTLVLPAHGDPFRGLERRLDQLAQHHEGRLDRLIAVCAEPATVVELLPHLFRRKLDDDNILMAAAEALAHVHLLLADGRLGLERGADGVDRYHTLERAADAAD